MNHETLKTIIYNTHGLIKRKEIVKRDYSFEPNANYIVTGIRRAGKSTLLHSKVLDLVKSGVDYKRIIYINFEDERLSEFNINDFADIEETAAELTNDKPYYFFDEIQNVEGWEKFARRLADFDEHVCITGCNATMLSKEMEAKLGARYMTKEVYTYSFTEYIRANDIDSSDESRYTNRGKARIKNLLDEYLSYGGFPEALRFEDKRNYVSNVYQKILLGDICARYGIRNTKAMELVVKKAAEAVRNEISYNRLRDSVVSAGVKISNDAVASYMNYAKEGYLLFGVQNYFAKFSERESVQKYYFYDNGILNLFLLDKKSSLLENIVALKLKRKYGDNFFTLKSSKTGTDIDFFVPETSTAIQVAWSIEGPAEFREVDGLVNLSKNFSEATRFIIVTYEEKKDIERNGVDIEVIPVIEFLTAML